LCPGALLAYNVAGAAGDEAHIMARIAPLTVAALVLWSGGAALAQPLPVTVRLGGRVLAVQPAPDVCEGALVAPWGAIARAAGMAVTFDRDRQALRILGPQRQVITLTPGATYGVGGDARPLSPPASASEGDLLAPLKPLCEALGWVLNWDAEKRTASIWGQVLSLVTRGDQAGVFVSVVTSLFAEPRVTQLDDPIRTVVDLPGTYLGQEPPVNYVNLVGVQRLRAGQLTISPPVARLVADLAGSGPRGDWQPRPDQRGGRLVFGKVQGNEPVVVRARPKLLKLVASSTGPDTATLTATLTDPVAPIYDVLRQPYRVLVDLCGAEVTTPAVLDSKVPFIGEIRLMGEGRLALHMDELVPFRVQTLVKPDRLVITFQRDRLAGKRIVVDAGHGGKDPGARGRSLLEKNINLDVAKRTVTRLAQMDALPVLTRDTDNFVELYDRPRLTNALKADLFVSIHCNAYRWDVGSGTQTYYCTPQSKCLAVALQDALWPALAVKDGGVHQARFCVVRETQIPAVLVELLFIDNKVEEGLLAKAETRQQAAAGICEGLRRYLEGTGSVPPAVLTTPGELPE
jgi:N-acetylmuramoyl-L-alanine amidase